MPAVSSAWNTLHPLPSFDGPLFVNQVSVENSLHLGILSEPSRLDKMPLF